MPPPHPPQRQLSHAPALSERTGGWTSGRTPSPTRMRRCWRRDRGPSRRCRRRPQSRRRGAQVLATEGGRKRLSSGGRAVRRREGPVGGPCPGRASTARRNGRIREHGSGWRGRVPCHGTKGGRASVTEETPPPSVGGEGGGQLGRHPPEVRGRLGEKYPPCQGRSASCGGDRRGQHWEAAPPQREGRCMGVKTSSQGEGDFAGGQTWVKNPTQHSTGSGPCSDRPKGGSDFDPIGTPGVAPGGRIGWKIRPHVKTGWAHT